MNIFFKTEHEYLIDRPFKHVRFDIEKMTTEKWIKYGTVNIIGEINDDNTFKFNQRFYKLNSSKPAFLTGMILSQGIKTKLTISVRPNYIYVILFYFFISSFICELFGIETFLKESAGMNLLTLTIMLFMVLGIMLYFRSRLKTKFETQLKIKGSKK